MRAKKQNSLSETVRDAAIGYSVIVLGVICFLLVLAIVMAGVRIVTGSGIGATPTANATTAITAADENETT